MARRLTKGHIQKLLTRAYIAFYLNPDTKWPKTFNVVDMHNELNPNISLLYILRIFRNSMC